MKLIRRNHGGRKIKGSYCIANQMIIMVHIFILSSNIWLKFKDQIKTNEVWSSERMVLALGFNFGYEPVLPLDNQPKLLNINYDLMAFSCFSWK